MHEDDGTRGWGPNLKAEMRRNMGLGGSRWLREENGAEWIGPSQSRGFQTGDVHQGDSVVESKAKAAGLVPPEGIEKQLAGMSCNGHSLVDIFRSPNILFPQQKKQVENKKEDSGSESAEDLTIEVDKKRRREENPSIVPMSIETQSQPGSECVPETQLDTGKEDVTESW